MVPSHLQNPTTIEQWFSAHFFSVLSEQCLGNVEDAACRSRAEVQEGPKLWLFLLLIGVPNYRIAWMRPKLMVPMIF